MIEHTYTGIMAPTSMTSPQFVAVQKYYRTYIIRALAFAVSVILKTNHSECMLVATDCLIEGDDERRCEFLVHRERNEIGLEVTAKESIVVALRRWRGCLRELGT